MVTHIYETSKYSVFDEMINLCYCYRKHVVYLLITKNKFTQILCPIFFYTDVQKLQTQKTEITYFFSIRTTKQQCHSRCIL